MKGQKVWVVIWTLLLTNYGILHKSLQFPYCKTQMGVGEFIDVMVGPFGSRC